MAVITRYVDAASSGGNGTKTDLTGPDAAYASLQAAITAQSVDLVTAGDSLVIICGGSTADTGAIANGATPEFPGMTTSATNDITIQAADNHNGEWNDSIYRLDTDGYRATFNIPADQFVTIIGLQINNSRDTSGGAKGDVVRVRGSGAGAATLDRCLLRHTGTNIASGSGKGVSTQDLTGDCVVNVRNCIAYDCLTAGFQLRVVDTSGGGAIHVANCTAVNCVTGFNVNARSSSGGVGSLRNCIAQDCTTDFSVGGGGFPATYTGTNNLSKDATATNVDSDSGASSIVSTTLTFRDAAAYDYHLAASDTAAIDAGVNLSATFTDDVDGVTRTGTWDIGADQFVAATGGLLGPLVGEGGLAGIGGLVGARGGIAG